MTIALILIILSLACIWLSTIRWARAHDTYSAAFHGGSIGLMYSGVSKLLEAGQGKLPTSLDIAVAVLTAIIAMSAQKILLQYKAQR